MPQKKQLTNEYKRRLCKFCGKGFPHIKKTPCFCSQACENDFSFHKGKCKPKCLFNETREQIVIFKDGTTHRRKVCVHCLKAVFIKKNNSESKEITELDKKSEINKTVKPFKINFSDPFYSSAKWLRLRYKALQVYGPVCHCCESKKRIHVDHIKPRSKYPELELDFNNLQILCSDCNKGKSNLDETDWRLERQTE